MDTDLNCIKWCDLFTSKMVLRLIFLCSDFNKCKQKILQHYESDQNFYKESNYIPKI